MKSENSSKSISLLVERTNKAEIRPEERREGGEFMERNTVERVIHTEIGNKESAKAVGKVGWFISKKCKP